MQYDSSTVIQYESSTVIQYEKSTAIQYESSVVIQFESITVIKYENCRDILTDQAQDQDARNMPIMLWQLYFPKPEFAQTLKINKMYTTKSFAYN